MRTRSAAPASQPDSKQAGNAAVPLEPSKPSKALILPSNASEDARFISLENPRNGALSRYYFCPKLGIYEFTAISPSASLPRSTLFTTSSTNCQQDKNDDVPETSDTASAKEEVRKQVVDSRAPTKASISKTARLLVATQVDILFFLLPILAPPRSHSAQKLFQPLDDMLDSQDTLSKSLKDILLGEYKPKVEARLLAICDTIDAGETMYRLNEEKLLQELLSKAERMAANGLPLSMEEQFVNRALELPVLSVKREDTSTSTLSDMARDANTQETVQDKPDSQSSTNTITPSTAASSSTSFTTASDASTPATETTPPTPNDPPIPPEIHHLLRLRTALSFIQSSYLPTHLSSKITTLLTTTQSPKDFTPLTEHLKLVAEQRAKALSSRSMGDFSRKRAVAEDDEAAETRAEKKRRKEEEEKKKKLGESRGVRDLKKVNVSGMKKLSAFFGKKT
ncbi:hypothetical protein FQN55_003584 [Onygenales sp. PD_40]|nr:hypothetical protein FQN55_003584 [Onygenales sp. PD_40]KAK2786880.1 hypothetical protein FQN52_007624 [Onygenales sp. PD_12]KAK2802699.1 hypothetical protein FQN51_004223 [Onygenales sp. PD_10]